MRDEDKANPSEGVHKVFYALGQHTAHEIAE